MKLENVKYAAKVCKASKSATLCLVGVSGSGKTSIWSQIYKELGFENYVILRPALLADAADLIGLPDFEIVEKGGKAVKTTSFMRPKWLPFEGEKCLIIIDEINRATKDVANALFGLIESDNPFIGEYTLPEDCQVVATCNPPTDNYSGVLDFNDSAWSSRLCFVKVAPNLETYTNYGRESKTVSNVMLDFLDKNQGFFGTSGDFEVDMFFSSDDKVKETNTRSFSKVSKVQETAKDLGINRNITFELIRGIVGLEFATSFMNHVDIFSTVVTVDELLNDPKAHERFDYTALSGIAKVLEDLKFKIKEDKVSVEKITNINPFLKKIPLDTLKGFLTWLVNFNNEANGDCEVLTKLADSIFEDDEINSKVDLFADVSSDDTSTETAENGSEEATDETN